jgi:hypothetical protein
MENQIAAADFGVTSQFLRVLAFLALLQQNGAPLPPLSPNESEEAIKVWRTAFNRRNEIYDDLLNEYRQRLLAVVLNKSKRARAISLETLISMTPSTDAKTADEAQANLKRALAPIFLELPPATQENLLESRWPNIAGEEMLPVLRQLYQNGKNAPDLVGVALQRIYELSPDEGRRLIIEEMKKPDSRVKIQTFTLLPDETLPEVDALVDERAGTDNSDSEVLLRLADRYASSAVAARLKSTYEERVGQMACTPQDALLSYFLRVDPDLGLNLVEKALASRKSTACYQMLLGDVARTRMSPELERIAISQVNDPDPRLVLNAVEMLGRYGSQDARSVLLRRFEQWNQDWTGRGDELVRQQRSDPLNSQERVELALLTALTRSPAWLADEGTIAKLKSLCVTRDCLSEAESLLKQVGANITVFFENRTTRIAHASIGQYNSLSWDQLKTKVTQYPKGTTFLFGSDRRGTVIEQKVFDELKSYLEQHEMKLRMFETEQPQ